IKQTEGGHGSRVALGSGLLVPLARRGPALTVVVKQAEVKHGACVALGSGLLVPLARLGIVPRHAVTAVVKRAEDGHGARVAVLRACPEYGENLLTAIDIRLIR